MYTFSFHSFFVSLSSAAVALPVPETMGTHIANFFSFFLLLSFLHSPVIIQRKMAASLIFLPGEEEISVG